MIRMTSELQKIVCTVESGLFCSPEFWIWFVKWMPRLVDTTDCSIQDLSPLVFFLEQRNT